MEELIELIFDNLWIVILIIGAIIGSLPDNKKKTKKTENTSQRQTVRRTDRPSKPFVERPTVSQMEIDKEHEAKKRTLEELVNEKKHPNQNSIEQLRKNQLRKLKKETKSIFENKEEEIVQLSKKIKSKKSKKVESHLTNNDVKQMFSKKGIVNSIIIQEILSEPRSKRPFRYRK